MRLALPASTASLRFLRAVVDVMEEIVTADYWSVPTCDDILFYMQQTRLILRAKGSRLCEAPSFYAAWTCFELAAERAFHAGHLKSCNLFCTRTFRAFVHKGEDYPMRLFDIVFSPTGGTEKASGYIANALEGEIVAVDLTDSGLGFRTVAMTKEDVAVIAVPSYGGRVPAVAAERLGMMRGNGAQAVLVCVYGNRTYEDTLVELEDVAKDAGFRVIAAVSAIAEHSIVRQFAAGRPDAQDATQLTGFADQIQQKISTGDASEPAIPGNRPYKKAGGAGMVPKVTRECTACGACVAACPVGAVDKDDPGRVDKKNCISCMRCVSVCPRGARKLNPVMLSAVTKMLSKVCAERKECELFI